MNTNMKLEVITPQIASHYLEANNTNRRLRMEVVRRYMGDMQTGDWVPGHSMIVFYADGELADGQHRLKAIELSGISQSFYVRRGANRVDFLKGGEGLPRSVVDSAKIAGIDLKATAKHFAISRTIETGQVTKAPWSNAEKLRVLEKHSEATNFAAANFPKIARVNNQMLLGAVGRAWYCEGDHDRLKRFCEIASSGLCTSDTDLAAVAIRNLFLSGSGVGRTAEEFRDLFLRSQRAISAFMNERPLSVVRAVSSEAYPLK
jgi:hypothetical protein